MGAHGEGLFDDYLYSAGFDNAGRHLNGIPRPDLVPAKTEGPAEQEETELPMDRIWRDTRLRMVTGQVGRVAGNIVELDTTEQTDLPPAAT